MNVHRIVGLPGETITIVDGVVMANGRPVPLPDELQNLRYPIPLAARPSEVWGTMEHPAQLGENEFFVLGDYASVSNDSRMRNRAVHRNEIEGVIECRYWPLWRYQAFK